MKMTSKERISAILKHQPTDRIGIHEHFWGEADRRWLAQGHLKPGEYLGDHFGFDFDMGGWPRFVADLDFKNVVIEEKEDSVLMLDGNGATMRHAKGHAGTPEHVDFAVKDRDAWEKLIRPKLVGFDPRRVDRFGYGGARNHAAQRQSFFVCSGVNVFELLHPICGHEHMLAGMALDPEWIADMCTVYSDMIITYWEYLFKNEGLPDGIWFYEDMGFKERPFMSPEMYRELIYPAHKKTIDWAHNLGLPVVMHSCGFIEPLLEGMVDAGVDCLQVIEVKAGMDPVRISKKFGKKLALCGGMDVRPLVRNDLDGVRKELSKIPDLMKGGGGYILHSDHSIPGECNYETYRYFMEEGLRIGTY